MTRFHTTMPWGITAVLVVCIVGLCGCGLAPGPEPLEFTITWGDADGLAPGQLLVYNGVRIGEVRSVELGDAGRVEVGVRIDPEHRHRVYREAEYLIEKPGGLTDISGERRITMKDRSSETKTPVDPGDIVEGTGGWVDRIGHWIGARGAWLREAGEELWTTASEWKESPEGQRLLSSLEAFADDAGEWTADQWEEFREDGYPAMEKRVKDLMHHLEEKGRSEEAQELWESFERFVESLPESGDEGRPGTREDGGE